jgi:small subunit ribosomal protein S6e
MFKLDIGDPKSKRTVHLETNSDLFIGRKFGDVIKGSEITEVPDFSDYEFIITGAADKAGFPSVAQVEGIGRKRVLLTRGKVLKTKKKGLRQKRTVRGSTISEDIIQINLKVSKEGAKPFAEIFKKPEAEKPAEEVQEEAKPAEEVKEETEAPEPVAEEKAEAEAPVEEEKTEEAVEEEKTE